MDREPNRDTLTRMGWDQSSPDLAHLSEDGRSCELSQLALQYRHLDFEFRIAKLSIMIFTQLLNPGIFHTQALQEELVPVHGILSSNTIIQY